MTAVADGLAQLNKIFTTQLPRRIDAIVTQFATLSNSEWDVVQLDHLHRLVHGLSGSAGTFGMPRVSDAARALEMALTQLLGSNTAPANWHALQGALQHLQSVAENEQAQPPQPFSAPATYIGSKTPLVYVVEDDAEQANRLREILVSDNYQVRIFHSIDEFRTVCEQQTWPDAVIMDIIFPEGAKAGVQTVAQLRANCPPNLPVVFASVRDDLEARLLAYRAGASRYLVKPVHPAVLLNLMARLTLRAPPDPYRVLLVDDDLLLTQALVAMLQQAGMRVRVEPSPLKAIAALNEFSPDVLLLDLYMPCYNGTDLAMVLREQEQYASLPIIFLSTETNLSEQNLALKLGGDDFLVKPVQPRALVQTVSTHARRRREILHANQQTLQLEIDRNRQQAREGALREQYLRADFFNNLSDPLLSPLNAILGYSQLIQMEDDLSHQGESVRDSVQEIGKAGQQLLGLINDILDLSKIEANRMEVQSGPVWLDELFIACESALQPTARSRQIPLCFSDKDRRNVVLQAEGTRLKQVLQHILLHVLRTSPAHSSVEIDWHYRPDKRLRMVIQSQSSGPGAEQWLRLITRHQNGHPLPPESRIGLILSHHLTELMGGQIGVDQGPAGHVFWIELPQMALTELLPEPGSHGLPGSLADSLAGSASNEQRMVLYIEDSGTNVRLMRKILLKRPHLLFADAPSAELGLPMASELMPDLILLDLNLPGMSGFSAIEKIRAIPGLAQTPIIAITANAMKGEAERVLNAGFTAYVPKPIDVTRLYALIDHILPPTAGQ
jgi:DNA-binding response OmpR family regulator